MSWKHFLHPRWEAFVREEINPSQQFAEKNGAGTYDKQPIMWWKNDGNDFPEPKKSSISSFLFPSLFLTKEIFTVFRLQGTSLFPSYFTGVHWQVIEATFSLWPKLLPWVGIH